MFPRLSSLASRLLSAFFKSQSLKFFQIPGPLQREKIIYDNPHLALLSPGDYTMGEFRNSSKFQRLYGENSEFFQVPKAI